jgi:hypothetical protein
MALGQRKNAASLAHHGWHRQLAAMLDWLIELWDFHFWIVAAICSALVALVSTLADRRRQRRRLLDQVGFVPWTGISIMAIGLTLIATALAIKAG